jgi:hypothetical protein
MATIIYEKDVKDDLECPVCKNRFEIPKNLPCGHLICNLCEIKVLHKTINCKICHQEHFVPEKGFPINHFLRKFLINSTFKGIKSAHINSHFDRAKSSFQILKENVKKKETEIKERCELIRNNIDIKAESIINRIQDYRQDLLQQIDQQEKKFLRKNEFEEYIKEFENKHENLALRINEKDLSDEKAKVIIEEIMEMEIKFDLIRKSSDEEMANINELSYEEGKDEPKLDLIGYLTLDSLVLNKLERLKFQQKEKSLNLPKSERECLIQSIGKDKFCYLEIISTSRDNYIEIKYQLYSLDCYLLKEKNQKLPFGYQKVNSFLTTVHLNSLVVFLKTAGFPGFGLICIFDIDFEIIKTTSTSFVNNYDPTSYLKLFSCNENIYLCLFLQKSLNLCIFKYDINLNLKETVDLKEQNDQNDQNDIMFANIVALKHNQIFTIQSYNSCQQLQVYLNAYDMNNLNLINKHQLSSINQVYFKVLAKEILIFLINNEFCLLNLKTKSLSKFRLNNLYTNHDSVFVSEDGHLIIHDKKLNVIHIIKSW